MMSGFVHLYLFEIKNVRWNIELNASHVGSFPDDCLEICFPCSTDQMSNL